MVIETFREGCREAVYARYAERGRMLPPGLDYIDSWVERGGRRCFQLMRCEEPALLERWAAQWDDLAEGLADPAASASAAAAPDAVAVRGCLERLQENQRQAILLAYYGGLTHEELSARLEAPLGTVKSWVRRGLLQLKECLEA